MLSPGTAADGNVAEVNGYANGSVRQAGGWRMTVLLIGIVTVTALVSVIAAALANESNARKRQTLRGKYSGPQEERGVDYVESQQAA